MTSDTITIEEIKEKTIPILRNYPVDKAILFGSYYAKGEATNNSDIDLYIGINGKLRGFDFAGYLKFLLIL